ncbi:GNAT family N-acetyltransferase [Aliiglaciecola sp.]|nr:GNAT family N-acetyltransferase [Aliiglaciecola sp.]
MIQKLENSKQHVANQIFHVFQNSYPIEAKLINASNFPPLARSARNVKAAKTLFYGFYEKGELAGVIEVRTRGQNLEIDSLTVEPKHFKKGIAGRLINHVLDAFEYSRAVVETAAGNEPAINLYKKHGFVEYKRWTPSHDIKKVAMSLENTL